MQTSIHWQLPEGIECYQDLDKPEGWGTSTFWYCAFCGKTYAYAIIPGRIWRASSGCCPACPGDRWNVPGSLECLATVGWQVPLPIAKWQLECELIFLTNPGHPLNERTVNDDLDDFLTRSEVRAG